MKDYHFESDNHDFDKTIKLDTINKEIKSLEEEGIFDDELGDKNAFLNAFESERFDESMRPNKPVKLPKNDVCARELGIWNKKTIGVIALVAVVVGIICFALVRNMFPAGERSHQGVDEEVQARAMIVKNILDGGEYVVYDIEGNTSKSISLAEGALIIDADGKVVASSAVGIGELLMIELDSSGRQALSMSFGEGIHRKTVSGLEVDTSGRLLVGEDESYSYDTHAVFVYNGESIKPGDLEPCNVLLLKGISDTVWVVEVLEYHGYIVIENKDNIKNGMFKLDGNEEIPLAEIDRIAVTEGTHTITVTGENIEDRTDQVFVEAGEEFIYDLSKAQEKVGVLIIDADVEDYKLYINGTLVDSTTPTVLPLGEYDIVILKSGYAQWDQHVVLDRETVTVRAELEKDVQYGTLVITSNEAGALVWINERAVGVTPLEVNLPYGMYQVTVEKEDFETYASAVTINTDHRVLQVSLTE